MEKSDEYIARRLKWKAEKHSLPSEYSLYFEEFTDEQKEKYSGFLKDQNIGIPTLIFTERKSKNWTIIGTRKILWNGNGQSQSLSYSDIKQIKPHAFDNLEKVNEAINNSMPKSEWNKLTVTEKNGVERNIYANNGSDFFAMWNIIRMAWQLN